MTESIYVVWRVSGDSPKCRHASIEQALNEAKRLADLNHGEEFIVLRAISSVTYRDSPYVTKCYSKKG
jgi:hypothetical protein